MSANAAPIDPFEFAQQGDFADSFTYTVPASGEVQPYTATATFANGSGQAVQPTVSMYSANGNLLARVFPVAALADGDTAEVTWMPPFGSAASSSGGGGGGITTIYSPDGSVTVSNPTGPTTDLSTHAAYDFFETYLITISAGSFRNFSGADWVHVQGDNIFSKATMRVLESAVYVFAVTAIMSLDANVGTNPYMQAGLSGAGDLAASGASPLVPGLAGGYGGSISLAATGWAGTASTITINVENNDTIDHNYGLFLMISRNGGERGA